jgi:hypothetical protein
LAAAVALALASTGAWAHDKWESGSYYDDDSGSFSVNQLEHGSRQTHDLEGTAAAPDQDWYLYQGQQRHSYEARVWGSTITWNHASGSSTLAATLERVEQNGTLLTSPVGSFTGVALRWINPSSQRGYLRVRGSSNNDYAAAEQYEIDFTDTTVFGPRWNNTSTQVTIAIVQNTTSRPLSGEVYFYSASGALLHTEPLSIAAYGVQVLNTSTVPVLAGQSGSLAVAHTGGYGAVAGKAVALEPATGFTFDTPLAPIPR